MSKIYRYRPFMIDDPDGKFFQIFGLVGELSSIVEKFSDRESDIFFYFFEDIEPAVVARNAYLKVSSRIERYEMIKAAAKELLSSEYQKQLNRDLKSVNRIYQKRNDIVHAMAIYPLTDEKGPVLLHSKGKRQGLTPFKLRNPKINANFIRQTIFEAARADYLLACWGTIANKNEEKNRQAAVDYMKLLREQMDDSERLTQLRLKFLENHYGPE